MCITLTILTCTFLYILQTFNELFSPQKTEADILSIVSKAEEFEQVKVRGQMTIGSF